MGLLQRLPIFCAVAGIVNLPQPHQTILEEKQ